MAHPQRSAPDIRDHETIRMIGRGAYGEVWMARGVTGALRAVKVVRREDYDHPGSFEREFEAIKKYEPVSRKHPGLVPVLQVGRNTEAGFYYYIMELADDLERGRDIDPATYRPHSLQAQMRRDGRVSAEQCIELGANVAEGLDHLHRNKLIHRDVKPSNLIFTDGSCKLADIGLVALLGQQSFVGTEGFVAPEGPGTPAADMFSLGMVLYEAATGKDRLDFPDIPSSRETGEKLEVWRRLNRVICRACAPKAKDRYDSALEMSLDLRGKPLPSRKRVWYAAAGAVAAIVLAVGFGMWLAQHRRMSGMVAVGEAVSLLSIKSAPAGAVVFAGEDKLGTTPLKLDPPEGVPVIYQLRLPGYKAREIEHTAEAGKPVEFDLKLDPSKLPQPGERWTNSIGISFTPRQGGHVSTQPVEMKDFRRFVEASGRTFEGKVVRFENAQDKKTFYIVVVPPGDADAFRYWMTEQDRDDGFLSQEHHYELEPFYFVEHQTAGAEEAPDGRDPETTSAEKNWQAFYLRVARQTYGAVTLRSLPQGMKVFQHEEFLGETPLTLERVRTGDVEYELRGEGFTDAVLEGEVHEGEILDLFANMDTPTGVSYGREWKNSQGMRFVPLGDNLLMAIWETRRRDYLEYAKAANGRRPPALEDASKSGTKPVTSVDRAEARGFCAWLTERERASGTISANDVYRLPTDEEWSRAVGLPLERGADPAERNGRIRGIYPWGFEWPPPDHIDNFADATGARQAGIDSVIPGYDDKSAYPANVTTLQPNERGIAGLAGNVSEWTDTDFNKPVPGQEGKTPLGTTRGGNWRSSSQEELLASTRTPVPPDTRRNTIGFRIVLVKKSAPAAAP
ncbi:MAG: SUMF1/EgtB/PvdO family nonheme iron enzyme [Verrucomicrobiaceae bacterium]|nr:SUMF1/EgtB/PvdO family nonheme iron enzyme [Verrucomicrobiaceae bacterium]